MSISQRYTADGPPAPESHRDRKARLTRRAIHVAAVHQVLENGMEQATVAAISAEAGVSTRTFFNYFASKEDAIVGISEQLLDDEQIAEFLALPPDGASLAADVARLIHTAFLLTMNDDEVASARRRIYGQHPELLRRQFEKNERLEQQVSEVVAARIRQHGFEFDSAESVEDIAMMLVVTCAAPLRASARWIAARDHSGTAASGPPEPFEPFERSIRLFLDVLQGPTS